MDIGKCVLPDREIVPLSSGIWSAISSEQRFDSYDKIARAYDWLVGNSLYNRIIWGCWANTYSNAARSELAQARDGLIIDVGCGSLVFTAKPYRSAALDRLVLFDRSLGMMKRGQSRFPAGLFVQGDASDTPFRDALFTHVLAWGLLHIVGSKSALFSEIRRISKPGAVVTISSLVLSERRIGNRMLRFLHSKGEAAQPETSDEVSTAFEEHFVVTERKQQGSMLFLTGRKDD